MPTTQANIDQILTRLSLRDLAEEAGAHFHGSTATPSSHCPLHRGDNPTAFHLYANGTRWHCFTRCPESKNDGDLITFYMHWKNLDFPTALRELSHLAGITPPHDSNQTSRVPSPPPHPISPSSSHPISPSPSHPISPSPSRPIPSPPSSTWQARAQACTDYARSQLIHPTTGAPVRAYLYSERGLTPDTQDAFQLGYIPLDLFDNPLSWGFNPLPLPTPHPHKNAPPPSNSTVPPAPPSSLASHPTEPPAPPTSLAPHPAAPSDPTSSPTSHRPTSPSRAHSKKIFIPRGIFIPGFHTTTPWYIKIRRPLPGDLLSEYIPPTTNTPRRKSNLPLPRSSSPVSPQPSSPSSPSPNSHPSTSPPSSFPPSPSPIPKFLSIRGSQPILFGRHLWLYLPTLLLVEGEFDCMLAWQNVHDLCDVATLGSASMHPSLLDLADLTRFQRILAVYDSDPAGDRARAYLSSYPRIQLIPSPAHDLTDYFRAGGDLRAWLLSFLSCSSSPRP